VKLKIDTVKFNFHQIKSSVSKIKRLKKYNLIKMISPIFKIYY